MIIFQVLYPCEIGLLNWSGWFLVEYDVVIGGIYMKNSQSSSGWCYCCFAEWIKRSPFSGQTSHKKCSPYFGPWLEGELATMAGHSYVYFWWSWTEVNVLESQELEQAFMERWENVQCERNVQQGYPFLFVNLLLCPWFFSFFFSFLKKLWTL